MMMIFNTCSGFGVSGAKIGSTIKVRRPLITSWELLLIMLTTDNHDDSEWICESLQNQENFPPFKFE